MRYILVSICLCFSISLVKAQTYEAGLMLGGTNFVGDVGSSSFIKPRDYLDQDKVSYGAILKWNRSPRHAFRFTAMRINTFGSDSRSNEPMKKDRRYSFKTNITELSLGLEFNFFEFDLHRVERSLFTPYIYTGPSYFFTNEFNLTDDGSGGFELVKGESISNFAIPMVFGLKLALSWHWILAAEFDARYTFTDNLDGSNTDSLTFGNSNMNDWYIFSGITLTYTFGRKPCYCNF